MSAEIPPVLVAFITYAHRLESIEAQQGIPLDWPAEARELVDGDDFELGEGWQVMTRNDFDQYKAIIAPAVDTWRESLTTEDITDD